MCAVRQYTFLLAFYLPKICVLRTLKAVAQLENQNHDTKNGKETQLPINHTDCLKLCNFPRFGVLGPQIWLNFRPNFQLHFNAFKRKFNQTRLQELPALTLMMHYFKQGVELDDLQTQ